MKRKILCLLLALLCIIPLYGCEKEPDPVSVDITLTESGEAKLYIQLPADTPAQILYAKDRLLFYVQEKTGATLECGTEQRTGVPTLTLGNGIDELSQKRAEKLEGDVFRIYAAEQRITLVATNDAFLYDAIDRLIEKMEYDAQTGTLRLSGVLDETAAGDKTSLRYMFTQSQTVATAEELSATVPHHPGNDPESDEDNIRGTQGGCRVGNYHYQAFIKTDPESNEMNNITYVGKYDLTTKQTVLYSELLDLNHANDMTYNSKTNELVIVHNAPRAKMLTCLDPDTLTITRRLELPTSAYAITYSTARDQYMIGVSGSKDLLPVSADMQKLAKKPYKATPTADRCTTQGICSDETFVYCVLWDSKYKVSPQMQNRITVYDWYGNYVGTVNITVDKLEPENISVENGTFFVLAASSKGGKIYRITPTAPVVK